MNTIAPELARRVRRNYLVSAALLGIATAIAVAALAAEASEGHLMFPPGAYLFSPYYSLFAIALAWLGVVYFLVQSHKLTREGPSQYSAVIYNRTWILQSMVGPIVLFGAVLMIPGSLLALQLGLTGLASVFPLFCGAFTHMQAHKINKDIVADRIGAPRRSYLAPVPASVDDSESVESASASTPAMDPTSGLAPKAPIAVQLYFVAALVLIGIHLVNEIILFTLYRDGMAPGGSMYSATFAQGFMMFTDIFVVGIFGVIVLVVSIINLRRGVPRRIGVATLVLSALSLVLVPGMVAPTLSEWTGPAAIDTAKLLEPQMALDSIHAYRITHEPATGPDGYFEHDYVINSLRGYDYDGTVPMFTDDAGALKWLQFDYPDQGSVCLFIGADVRDPANPAVMTEVSTLDDMAYFGDLTPGECVGERTLFDRY